MTRVLSYVKRHHLALLCVVLILTGGTAYASKAKVHLPKNTVASKQVKDGSLTGSDLKDDKVTGADVQEASLGQVPSAANANTVGGTPAGGLLQTAGCQRGKVLGSVLVLADGAIGSSYATAGADNPYNCSGGAVDVRRLGLGRHFVRFASNPSNTAVVQVRFDRDVTDEAACGTVEKVDAGPDAGAFQVTTFDCGSDAVVNVDFTLVLS